MKKNKKIIVNEIKIRIAYFESGNNDSVFWEEYLIEEKWLDKISQFLLDKININWSDTTSSIKNKIKTNIQSFSDFSSDFNNKLGKKLADYRDGHYLMGLKGGVYVPNNNLVKVMYKISDIKFEEVEL